METGKPKLTMIGIQITFEERQKIIDAISREQVAAQKKITIKDYILAACNEKMTQASK